MSTAHVHSELEKKEIPKYYLKTGVVLTVVGLVLAVLSYMSDPARAVFNNLVGFTFLASIAGGTLFFVALEYLAGAIWSTPFRRVFEFFGGIFPFVILLAIPLFMNMHTLFHWTHAEAVAADKVLQSKAPYLNEQFFYIRFAFIVGGWALFSFLINRNSKKQDVSNDQHLTRKNIKLSTAFIPFFAISASVFAIDWLMSIEAHWFSTMFGVYYFIGTIIAALAVVTFIIVDLSERGLMFKGVRKDHYYSFGAFLFALTSFWAYIAFSQFMLIWYANLPEENFWFIARWQNGWQYVSIAMTLVHFWIPYFLLLSRSAKMNPTTLKISAVILVLAHFLDMYWLVMPTHSATPIFSYYEIAFPMLTLGIVLLVFAFKAKKNNLLPVGDPKLQRGIDFRL